MNKSAEKFYYLLDACGGHCTLTLDSTPDEIEGLFQCSKEEFTKNVHFLIEKGIVKADSTGITIVAPWKEKMGNNK